jgi:hypothetical protein
MTVTEEVVAPNMVQGPRPGGFPVTPQPDGRQVVVLIVTPRDRTSVEVTTRTPEDKTLTLQVKNEKTQLFDFCAKYVFVLYRYQFVFQTKILTHA